MLQVIIMTRLTESIDNMFKDWFNEITRTNLQKCDFKDVINQIEYERAILNKLCCITEDLNFYKILDRKDYFSIQDCILVCYRRLNAMEYVWRSDKIIYDTIYEYKIGD